MENSNRKGARLISIYIALAVVILLAVGYRVLRAEDKAPEIGTPAPDFTLTSQEGKTVSLHDFKGQWVVLYFYPKDFTTGCTIEAHNFQRDQAQYDTRHAAVIGISMQDEDSHLKFCTKEGLSFKLLADTKAQVSQHYGSVMNLGVTKLSARHTFLIDPNGVIRKIYLEVKPSEHSAEVLAALDELQKNSAAK